jgi:hypothetical protein
MATVSGTQRQLTHTSNTYESNGGLTIGGNLNINGSGTVDGRDIAVDGVKLDGIATGANNYSLPAGTSSERGGFKIGYSENGKNYPVEVSSEQMFVSVPWTDANTVYTHPTQTALTVDVNANSGATILSTLDIVVNTLGHVTSASSTTRTLTAADLGVAAGANNYSLPSGTSSARGGFKIGYSENGKNYPVEVLSEQMFVNVPWTDANTVYTHPTQSALTVDVNANSAATILSTLDIAVNTLGHVTSASSTTRTLTAADLGVAAGANNYSLPSGTSSARGGFKIGYSENGKNYPVEVLSEQMFVNVPWTDANTTYSAGSGISLSSTTFSVAAGDGLTQTATGLSHTDTSSQGSINNSNGTVIQDVTLDTYGHVTSIGSYNLDSRYYTETESDGRYLRNSVANSLTNVLTISEASNGNIVYDLANNGVYIPKPIGASYHTLTNVHTGAIAIKLPTTSWNNSDMVSFHVDIYDYAGDTNGESVTLYIYGYHQGALSWANVGAVISSTLPDKDYTVRFGHDGTRPIVWIGETTSVWNFPQISVRDFQAGNTANHLSYDSGWEVVPNATSFGTISKTSTGNYPYAKAIIGPIYTVSSLPAASPAGQRGFISDSSGELATSHGAVAFGGGSTTIPVYSDGSSWRIG